MGIWRPLAASILIVSAGVMPVFLTGAMAVQVRASLGFDAARLGVAVAVFYAAAAVSSIPGGRMAERIGARLTMRLAAALSLAAMVQIALTARSFATLIIGVALGGIANGIGQPATNLYLARAIPPDRQGTAFGIKQAAIPTATMLGGLAVPAVALTVGWQWAYLLACALPLAGVALLPAGPVSRTNPRPHHRAHASAGLALGALAMLALAGALGSAAGNVLGAFLVQSAVAGGTEPGMAGLLAALGSAAGLASRLLSGMAADRREGGHLVAVAVMLILGAVGFALLATGSRLALVPATVLSFAAGWGWNGLFNLAVVRSHPHAAGSATGLTQTGVLVGGAVGPVAFGFAVVHGSYGLAWTGTAVAVVLAATAVLWGRAMLAAHARAGYGTDEHAHDLQSQAL